MKKIIMLISVMACLLVSATALAGNGYMGGKGNVSDKGSETGPQNDKKSDQGSLYGDLYVIERYRGNETKLVPEVDSEGNPYLGTDGIQDLVPGPLAIGGEPVLSEFYGVYTQTDDTGNIIVDTNGDPVLFDAIYPSQCVQPLASYTRWGSIDSVLPDGFENNRLPIVAIYDATWERTECEVGVIQDVRIVQGEEGQEAEIVVGGYFIEPGDSWNGLVYPAGVLWKDLITEVSFGRLNLGRAPDAVLDHAFDEAVRSINNAISIDIDASGRLLLTSEVYDEFLVDSNGDPLRDAEGNLLYGEIVTKAIDSPLENLALYVKLIQDGHLITPVWDRTPIDRSIQGGMPIWKLLEMEDGPSDALRPTIDVSHFNAAAKDLRLLALVDAGNLSDYYTYWLVTYLDDEGKADSRELKYGTGTCALDFDAEALTTCTDLLKNCVVASGCNDWYGAPEVADSAAVEDFVFSAAFLAAAADKTGQISIDKVVYLNSILNINKVVGYSAYNEDGTPAEGAINYAQNPIYFDFSGLNTYNRQAVMNTRGENKDGNMRVLELQSENPSGLSTWEEVLKSIYGSITFRDHGITVDPGGTINYFVETDNVHGFTQISDDDLAVIEYIHTYQVPELR